jgi:hypothetical protein
VGQCKDSARTVQSYSNIMFNKFGRRSTSELLLGAWDSARTVQGQCKDSARTVQGQCSPI